MCYLGTVERGEPYNGLVPDRFYFMWIKKGPDGRVWAVWCLFDDSEKGLGSGPVFQQLLRWAELGLFGGVVLGSWFNWEEGSDETVVPRLRAILLYAVAQAFCDSSGLSLDEKGLGDLPGGSDPYQLALWALRKSAVRMSEPSSRVPEEEPIFFVCDVTGVELDKTGWGAETWRSLKQAIWLGGTGV